MSDSPTPIACKRAEERDQAAIAGGKMACAPCYLLGVASAFAVILLAVWVAVWLEMVARLRGWL